LRYNARYFVTATDLMSDNNGTFSEKGWKAALTAFYDAAGPAQPNARVLIDSSPLVL